MHTYTSKLTPRWLLGLMALIVLVTQSASIFASMAMEFPVEKTSCHEMVMQQDQPGDELAQQSQCQQSCCENNTCATQCSHCVVVTAGIMAQSFKYLPPSAESQFIGLRADQLPSGSEPSSLYRPPRSII